MNFLTRLGQKWLSVPPRHSGWREVMRPATRQTIRVLVSVVVAWIVGSLIHLPEMIDLRTLGSDRARLTARGLVSDWLTHPPTDPLVRDACVTGRRLASWLSNHEFCLASADRSPVVWSETRSSFMNVAYWWPV